MADVKTLEQTTDTIFEDDLAELHAGMSCDYVVDGHHMRVTGISARGFHTGRRRYSVECLTCGEVVHKATTGPRWNLERHPHYAAEDAARAAAKDAKR